MSNQACQSLLQLAHTQSVDGNLDDAERLYKAAYRVRADPGLLFNIARVLHKQGRSQEAVTYYKQFLNSQSTDSEQKSKAQEHLNSIQSSDSPSAPLSALPSVPAEKTSAPALSLNRTSEHILSHAGPQNLLTRPDITAPSASLHKKWWLWAMIGSTVATAVGCSVWVTSRPPRLPTDIHVYQPGF